MPEDLQDLFQQLDEAEAPAAKKEDLQAAEVEDIKKIGTVSAAAATTITEIPPPSNGVDIKKYLGKLDSVTDEILISCRSDRQEAQDVINLLRDQIERSLNQNQLPSRMYVDGLVAAVEVKANINMTAVKIIEANAKMLAATKATGNNVLVSQNVNVAGNDSDLEKILDEPITHVDEF